MVQANVYSEPCHTSKIERFCKILNAATQRVFRTLSDI